MTDTTATSGVAAPAPVSAIVPAPIKPGLIRRLHSLVLDAEHFAKGVDLDIETKAALIEAEARRKRNCCGRCRPGL
jgi:hypothetical protein